MSLSGDDRFVHAVGGRFGFAAATVVSVPLGTVAMPVGFSALSGVAAGNSEGLEESASAAFCLGRPDAAATESDGWGDCAAAKPSAVGVVCPSFIVAEAVEGAGRGSGGPLTNSDTLPPTTRIAAPIPMILRIRGFAIRGLFGFFPASIRLGGFWESSRSKSAFASSGNRFAGVGFGC